jgi:hypothetical protein
VEGLPTASSSDTQRPNDGGGHQQGDLLASSASITDDIVAAFCSYSTGCGQPVHNGRTGSASRTLSIPSSRRHSTMPPPAPRPGDDAQ